MTHTRQAPAEVSEDLVDHRRLGDSGGEAHRAVAGPRSTSFLPPSVSRILTL
jgi:hypothetical protein